MKWWEDFKNHCRKLLKIFNSFVFYYSMMKWCEDCENQCWKFWKKSSILMYSIILWWNDVRISKIIVEKFWKKISFMYFIILWWNDVRISKIFAANFEIIFHKKFSNPHRIPSQNIVEFKRIPFCIICNNDFWNPHSISSQSEEYI